MLPPLRQEQPEARDLPPISEVVDNELLRDADRDSVLERGEMEMERLMRR